MMRILMKTFAIVALTGSVYATVTFERIDFGGGYSADATTPPRVFILPPSPRVPSAIIRLKFDDDSDALLSDIAASSGNAFWLKIVPQSSASASPVIRKVAHRIFGPDEYVNIFFEFVGPEFNALKESREVFSLEIGSFQTREFTPIVGLKLMFNVEMENPATRFGLSVGLGSQAAGPSGVVTPVSSGRVRAKLSQENELRLAEMQRIHPEYFEHNEHDNYQMTRKGLFRVFPETEEDHGTVKGTLGTDTLTVNEASIECSICLRQIREGSGEDKRDIPESAHTCDNSHPHLYHTECLRRYFGALVGQKGSGRCPVCRTLTRLEM